MWFNAYPVYTKQIYMELYVDREFCPVLTDRQTEMFIWE